MQSVARLARAAGSNAVGKNNVITIGVEELAGTKQHASVSRNKELAAGVTRAVKDHHSVRDAALRVVCGLAHSHVVQL